MIGSLETFCVIALLLLHFEQCNSACARAEYEINGECCPMCAPGTHVYRHCTEYTSTTCVPCTQSTYAAEPNGLSHCLSCKMCDSGQGLRVKTPCTLTSDTVCKPLNEYYCIDLQKDSCRHTEKHTTCSPGQYIKHKGTAFTDTVCDECADGTYSNSSLQNCQEYSK
ncbi:tumor necrosis factor receptor superfamily member 14-like [Trichomycterus rosablanca]|uniref:tumor necrosis factor receptor superfamily member 14-like n=1 Tax=Trichomycterus rosablanca TaxID=2290929 RepID=UPI002F35C671